MTVHQPRNISGLPACVGITELCTFQNPVYTPAGRVEPSLEGFTLHFADNRDRKPEVCAKAETAVRRLQKLVSSRPAV
jgi:hypothetical protein